MYINETYGKWKLWDEIFQIFLNFEISTIFCMFCTYLNIGQIRIFEKSWKSMIWSNFGQVFGTQNWFFWNFFRQTLNTISNLKNVFQVRYSTQSLAKKISEKINSAFQKLCKNSTISWIFKIFRKSGSGRCSNRYKTCKK
jgi:hypothetical protein